MATNATQMPKEDRLRMVIGFLAERDVMLPPKALYVNLKEYKNITFTYRTVQRLLSDSVERGLVNRLERESNTYYQISDKGRKFLADDLDDSSE